MKTRRAGWSARLRSALRPYHQLEKALGYRFRNEALLLQALTHRSYRFEHREVTDDNQRLEFLGDAVLGLEAATVLYSQFPGSDEGMLTSLRAQLTSGEALAEIGRQIGIGKWLRLGRGEERGHGRTRPSNLADAVEALLGAVYLDGGAKAARRAFERLFADRLSGIHHDSWAGNPKGKLQEIAQRVWKKSPSYHVLSRTGPAHRSTFTVEVRVGDALAAVGSGASKQQAECRAAAEALARLGPEEARAPADPPP